MSAVLVFWAAVSAFFGAAFGLGGPPPVGLNGLANFQTVSPSGVTSKTMPNAPALINVFPFGRRWAPEMNHEKKSFLFGRGVAPERLGRAEGSAFRADVMAVLVGRRNELIDRGVFLGLATAAVIEDEQVAFATESLGNPLDVVLDEEALIEAGAVAVGSWVAPAVEDIAPFAPATAGVALGFVRGGAVVDDPDLAEMRDC